MIVGTVNYMSPEQAEGKQVDHRTDIFSLGIILYEMATGERPFKGDTTASMLSSILKDTPQSVTNLNPVLPRELAKIIRRCLTKNPEDRLQAAKDLRNELRELKQEIDSGELQGYVRETGRRSSLWPAVSGALVVALVIVALLSESRGPDLGLRVIDDEQLTSLPGHQRWSSIHPDGDVVVFSHSIDGRPAARLPACTAP